MESNEEEEAGASGSSSDAGDEFAAPPNKVRRIVSPDRVEFEVLPSSSFENELTQEDSDSKNVDAIDDETPNSGEEDDNTITGESENSTAEKKKELEAEGNENEENEETSKEQKTDDEEEINDRTPLSIEVYDSLWRNKTLCTMLWRKGVTSQPQAQTSSNAAEAKAEINAEENESLYTREDSGNTMIPSNGDVVEANAERKPTLICLQLSTSGRATPASYPLCVDQNYFRSNQVKWELKAFDSQRKAPDWEIFKGDDSRGRVEKHYEELFPSKVLAVTAPNDPPCINPVWSRGATTRVYIGTTGDCREDGGELYRQNSPVAFQVDIRRTTYREAAIEWSSTEHSLSTVDKWLVVIRNEGRKPSNSSDRGRDQNTEWMIILKSQPSRVTYRIDNNLVKLEYQAGHRYVVQVIGLQRKYKDLPNNGVECYAVIAFSDKSFRAENTEEDYRLLLSKARRIREHLRGSFRHDPDSRMCHYLYRDKLKEYFKDLEVNNNNVMAVYVKDANGDPASAIHDLLKGLFFSANVNFATDQPMSPPRFGDKRVLIPPEKILTEDTKMYFADFYCLNTTHLVTLVVTRANSEADEICREKKLPLLSRSEQENPFLYYSTGGSVYVSSRITVEVFYTEDIDLKELGSRYNGKWGSFGGWVNNRKGDKWKNSDCLQCNLYTARISGAFLV